MVFLGVALICFLVFGSGAPFRVPQEGQPGWSTGATSRLHDGPAPAALVYEAPVYYQEAPTSFGFVAAAPSESSRPPLPFLQHEPSAALQPGVAPLQASSPTGNQSPSSPGAPSGAHDFLVNLKPEHLVGSYDASSDKPPRAPEVPPQSAGYVSPPVQSQPGVSTVGHSNVGVNVAAYSPVYNPAQPASANTAPASHFEQPARYAAAPLVSPSNEMVYYRAPTNHRFDGAAPYNAPGFGYESPRYAAAPAALVYEAPVYYEEAPTSGFGAAAPYGLSNEGSLSWPEQPARGFHASFDPSSWMPSSSFPDFGVWGSEDAKGVKQQSESQETSPLPSSSYIIQSRNGYLRAREDLSHMNYVPEYPEPQVIYYEVVERPQKSAPVADVKGGKKY